MINTLTKLLTNSTGNSGVDMISGDEYYNTYFDEFGESTGVGLDNVVLTTMVNYIIQDNFLNTILIQNLQKDLLTKHMGGLTNDK